MTYFTKDITTAEGTAKKQFYKSIGMEDFTTGEMVQVRQWVGEYSLAELSEMKTQVELQLSEINEKIGYFS